LLHATAVAVEGKAAVIMGASGRGKSTLALAMMSRGATLICDDRVQLGAPAGVLTASAVDTLAGKIEVRGVGIVNARFVTDVTVGLFVDLDIDESTRLPPERSFTILGQKAPLYNRINGDHFADALMQILKFGRYA
jgi:HPr kinase/phosphorylase